MQAQDNVRQADFLNNQQASPTADILVILRVSRIFRFFLDLEPVKLAAVRLKSLRERIIVLPCQQDLEIFGIEDMVLHLPQAYWAGRAARRLEVAY